MAPNNTYPEPQLRFLFPTLPPELRNVIYAYASSYPGSTTGVPLPFTTKTFTSAYTTLTICPTHTGNPALLALERYSYAEAYEYRTWLLTHGIELRVSVVVGGNLGSFSQQHWDMKTSTSLKTLFGKYTWMATAARWDVRVVWDVDMHSMERSPGRAATIVNGIVATLGRFQDPVVMRKRGDVAVRLYVPHSLAGAMMVHGVVFGLGRFLNEGGVAGPRREVREVVTGNGGSRKNVMATRRLQKVEEAVKRNGLIRVLKGGGVEWSEDVQGTMVMRKVVQGEEVWREALGNDEGEKGSQQKIDWRVVLLRSECEGVRSGKAVYH